MAAAIDPERILADVLKHMPEEAQAARGPVEARRWLLDAITARRREGAPLSEREADALFDRLEAAIALRFGPDAAASGPGPEAPPPSVEREIADLTALEESLQTIIAQAFSAPADGSPERAAVLAQRARGTVRNQLAHSGLPGFRRLRLRARAERLIASQAAEIGGVEKPPFWTWLFG